MTRTLPTYSPPLRNLKGLMLARVLAVVDDPWVPLIETVVTKSDKKQLTQIYIDKFSQQIFLTSANTYA